MWWVLHIFMRTFSFSKKVPFPFDQAAFFRNFLPSLPLMFSTDLSQQYPALLNQSTKFLEELLFGIYHARVKFLDRTQTLLLLYLNENPFRRYQTNFEILKTSKENICGGISFPIIIGGWIGQFDCLKGMLLKTFFL